MSILDFNATREEWLDTVKKRSDSERSSEAYRLGIARWDDFLEYMKLSDSEVLKELKKKNQDPDTYLFLNKYISYLVNKGVTRATINLYFAALRSWCAANGVMLFNEYIKRFVQLPKQKKELKASLTPEIIAELVNRAPTKRFKAALLVLLSSGMRISEVLQLRPIDINPKTNPVTIKVRAGTTKTREERISYMSNEAWEEVKILLEKLEPTEFIFVNDFTVSVLASFETRFGRLRKECGFLEKYDNTNRYHVNIHAFRAYFMTQATKVLDGDTAHALIGHRKYLDVYYRLTDQEKSDMYHKLEPYITVNDAARKQTIIDEKQREIDDLKKMKDEVDKLKAWKKRSEKIKG